MAINEGNNVTAETMAAAIVMAQQKLGAVPAPVAAKTSKLQERLDAMDAHPDSDRDAVAALKNLFADFEQDIKADMTQKQREEMTRELALQRDRQAVNIIKLSLADYIKGDDFLKEYEQVLTDKVIAEFNGNKEYEKARERYSNMDIDLSLLKEIALNEVSKFNKARGKETVRATGSAGMRKDSLESKHIATESESGGGRESGSGQLLDRDEMTPKERALYDARIGTVQRIGLKRDSKEARESASRAVLQLRNAKLKKQA